MNDAPLDSLWVKNGTLALSRGTSGHLRRIRGAFACPWALHGESFERPPLSVYLGIIHEASVECPPRPAHPWTGHGESVECPPLSV